MRIAATAMLVGGSAAAATGDMLPLTRGIYVREGAVCRGASNSDIKSYWGRDNGLNVSKVGCRVKRLTRRGAVYSLQRRCTLMEGGIVYDRAEILIANRRRFMMDGEFYRYCGPRVS